MVAQRIGVLVAQRPGLLELRPERLRPMGVGLRDRLPVRLGEAGELALQRRQVRPVAAGALQRLPVLGQRPALRLGRAAMLRQLLGLAGVVGLASGEVRPRQLG
jgi:hypothetical protein